MGTRGGNYVTSVIDKTIDSAPFPEDIIHQSLWKCLVQDIAREALGLSALLAYLADHLLSFTPVQVVDGDYGALLAQKQCSCTANSLCATSYENNMTINSTRILRCCWA